MTKTMKMMQWMMKSGRALKNPLFGALLLLWMLPLALLRPATAQNWTATGSLFVDPAPSALATARYQHTASVLSNDKVLVAGGYLGSSLASCELYDPAAGTWSATGSLNVARSGHTASVLSNGKVLVAGGINGSNLASCELYDPATGTWSATGSLNVARSGHTASVLSNGKVLVAGGYNGSPLAICELYDPTIGTWSTTGSLKTGHYIHTASVLSSGKVLLAGGFGTVAASAGCELYDPTSGTWSTTGSLSVARYNHTASVLSNGKVLVAGGQPDSSSYLTSCALYDPSSGTWSATGSLNTGRGYHTASVLSNGKVLVAGGFSGSGYLASCELYDPATGTWSATGSLNTARYYHTASVLNNGKVLVTGGFGSSGYLASCALYDPSNGTWLNSGTTVSAARDYHTASVLSNGKVLVTGGYTGSSYLATCSLYDPATGTWSQTGSLSTGRYYHTASVLSNGKVLVAGGFSGSGYLASCELYDPATGTWSATGSLNTARYIHTASVLSNGKVLVTGGFGSSGYLASCELYDPTSGTWSTTGSLRAARDYHTANVLSNGKVLVAGGYKAAALSSCELYDPTSGTWSNTGSLGAARYNYTASVLSNGKVLAAGGYDLSSRLASCELYDLTSGTWSTTGSLNAARSDHTASVLSNGKVLVAGGVNGGYLASCELYDLTSGTWSTTGSLNAARAYHTASVLSNGKVLAAGGYGGSYLASCELYSPAPNIAPVLANNNAITLNVTTTATIDNTKLKVTDADNDPITYTLTTAPTKGTLKLNGVALGANSTFTQADIDANNLTYTAGGTTGSDSFMFSASDGQGGSVAGNFNITITEAQSLVVTTNIDNSTNTDGLTSLREAIVYANNDGVNSAVTFDSTFFATQKTITLSGTQLSLASNGTLSITGPTAGVIVSGNNASRVFNVASGANVTLSGLTIMSGRNTLGDGGGINNFGTLKVQFCTLSYNYSSYAGGGIYSSGTLTVENSTLNGNTDDGSNGQGGGAIFTSGTATLLNSTLNGNSTTNSNSGGGIYVNAGTTTLVNCTVSGNSATDQGGGLYRLGGTLNVGNSIVAGNSATNSGPDIGGAVVSQGNNLLGKSNGSSGITNGTNGDQAGTTASPLNPQLGALTTANGGPTATMSLASNSPAVNAGSNTLATNNNLTTDQRGAGYPRSIGGTVDIGAYESSFLPPPTLSISDVTANEGQTGTTAFTFVVTRSGDTTVTSSVHYATANGTATAPSDYTAITDTVLNFAANETSKNINVTVNGDTTIESDETFFVNFTNPSNATITKAQGIGTITNDDFNTAPTASNTTLNGTQNSAFSGQLLANDADNNPLTYSIVSGTLPNNLSLNTATGAITGTPTVAGVFNLTFKVNDGTVDSSTANLTITIIEEPSLVVTTTADTTSNTDGVTSLREAITYANSLSSNDEVTFAVTGTITLSGTLPQIVATGTGGKLTITGPSGGITISGNNAVRILTVASGGNLTLDKLTLTGGKATGVNGGAILSNGTLSVSNSTVSNSTTTIYGGAIFSTGSTTVSGTTVSGNTGNDGGAIYNNGGTLTVSTSTFSGNTGTSNGGAIFSLGLLTVTGSTFSGNTGVLGSAICHNTSVSSTLANCTFSGNTATSQATYYNNTGVTTFTHCTISGNTSVNTPGGIYVATGSVALKNTLVVGNGSTNVSGTISDGGGNLTTGTAAAAGLDAQGLQPNGGPTKTIALTTRGTAVNTGSNANATVLTTDQRGAGYNRIIGGTVDIGAYESGFLPLPTLAINDVATNETNSGTTTFTFTVTRSGDLSGDSSVNYATANGTTNGATAGSDYVTKTGTLTFNAGETTKDVMVTVNGDTTIESDEIFFVNLSNPTGATISDSQGLGTITNDDFNTAPVASNQSVTTDEDTAKSITLGATDNENDALTYTITQAPAHGALVNEDDSAIVNNKPATSKVYYMPTANYNGVDSFKFKANDGTVDSNEATVSITVTALNDAPVANAQAVTTDEDTAKSGTLTGSDVDGNALTYSIVSNGSKGTAVITNAATGAFTYTPNANGSDSFTFKVSDGTVDSTPATVTVNITAVNDAPLVNAGSDGSANSGQAFSRSGSFSDPDADTWTSSVDYGDGSGTQALSLANDKTFSLSHTYTAGGTYTVTVSINDGTTTGTATFAVTVNSVPVAADQAVETDEDVSTVITLSATDGDGDALTYSIMQLPAHGTLTNQDGTALGRGNTLNNNKVKYTPAANYNGVDEFQFKASDGKAASNTATVSITIDPTSDAPFTVADLYATSKDEPLTVATPGVLANDNSPDGFTLTASLYRSVRNGSLSFNADGSFTYTPNRGFNGSDTFYYIASDGALESAPTSVTILVQAPVSVASFTPKGGPAGTLVTVTGSSFDNITNVQLNGQDTLFSVVSNSKLTFTVPKDARSGRIKVVTGHGSGYSTSDFIVAPSNLSFSPANGPANTVVTVSGINFDATSKAFIGNSAAKVTGYNATQLFIVVPGGAVSAPIKVTNAGGTGISSSNFVVNPNIASFTPAGGAPGAVVSLSGNGFGSATAVLLNGVSVGAFTKVSSSKITFTVPVGATTGLITVVTPAPEGNASSLKSFVVAPRLSSFTPGSGKKGDVVTINGENLGEALTTVKINGVTASVLTRSATQLTVRVPATTTGPIRVTNAGGSATSTTNFTITR